VRVEVDDRSGFCFGVVNAITQAEKAVGGGLVSLGDIVHNDAEMARLRGLGLEVAPEQTDLATLAGRRVLVRAHGEPPETYARAREWGVEVIDATCPVVARLQSKVARAHAEMKAVGGQVVIFGRRGHAEVRGLAGQVGGDVEVIEGEADLEALDLSRPVCLVAQTTGSLAEFRRLGELVRARAADPGAVTVMDTICRQVSGREEHLAEFAARFDAVVFVSGAKSSNGRVLFDAVSAVNPRSHKVESAADLRAEWFGGVRSVGVCGATSTPRWLMNDVAEAVAKIV